MYKKTLWTITFISSLMFSQIILADSSACREGLSETVQSLNLDSAQKAKIKPILSQLKLDVADSKSKMNGLDEQINQQVNSQAMDQTKVNDLVDQEAKLIGDMMKAKIEAKNQIISVLNPQQKAKLQSKLQAVDKKMAEKYEHCDQI